ncbi:MAG: erythromycin biosynthesis sensory transduction protein eryC1 [Candidatus Eremiobacter antarcticus]|nr:MAG: erythromycin biosynthesis sensory transduction protein eryC1 [Candidatus Eremiobacter sp. RRmetagenome_bin22]
MNDLQEVAVPFFDLQGQLADLRPEFEAALDEIYRSATFIMGPQVERFEEAFADFCGASHCVSVGSGTAALKLTLQALEIGPGDEVIVPANTYIASALAVSLVGARPVPVDIDQYYHMDPALVEQAITPRTKALMPVHLYGQAMPMTGPLRLAASHGLKVVEDACQAHGAIIEGRRAGTIGDAGCFSFYPSKNLGALGDGGAVVTNDAGLAEAVRLRRDFGQRKKYEHLIKGENSRLDTIQAAFLLAKLKHLTAWNDRRRALAASYDRELAALGVRPPLRRAADAHVYHLYVIEFPNRDRARAFLQDEGIHTGVHYPVPFHRQPAYADLDLPAGSLPKAERSCLRVLSLPMFPEMTDSQLGRVVRAIRSYLNGEASAGYKVLSGATV